MSQSIARIITSNRSAPDYLAEVEDMIACWEMHRSGKFENFANRLIEMGEGLTLRTFSETKLDFLRATLASHRRFGKTDHAAPENCDGTEGSRTMG